MDGNQNRPHGDRIRNGDYETEALQVGKKFFFGNPRLFQNVAERAFRNIFPLTKRNRRKTILGGMLPNLVRALCFTTLVKPQVLQDFHHIAIAMTGEVAH